MHHLGPDRLELRAKPHQKLIHAQMIPLLSNGSAANTRRAAGSRHLIQLAPHIIELHKESLDGAITLVSGGKCLHQGVFLRLAGGKVELSQMIPYLLGSQELRDGYTNGDLNRLAKNRNDPGVVIMPFLSN